MAFKVVCISASNARNTRRGSTSTRACQLIAEIITDRPVLNAGVEILKLVDFEFTPCQMCGDCYISGQCDHDPGFNAFFTRLEQADALIVVCPHYAPLPAKLVMALEKMLEISYLNACANPEYSFPLRGKPVGLVVHGGQGEEALPYYRRILLETLAQTFSSLQMRIIPGGDDSPLGVAFGITSLSSQTDSVFVRLEHDWAAIRRQVTPLIENVIAACGVAEK